MSVLKIALTTFFIVPLLSSCTQVSSSAITDNQKAIVFLMLSQTTETKIHQMRGANENQVYLHKDGHKEAVYDAQGKLVQDGINDGSYNFRTLKMTLLDITHRISILGLNGECLAKIPQARMNAFMHIC